MNKIINCTINKKHFSIMVNEEISLLEMLRKNLKLTGTKEGCSVGECGACSVIINDIVINSCIYLAIWADNKKITTIEGISSPNGKLSDLQKNFIDCGAIQCGFCTPGLILTATIFLKNNPKPTEKDIRKGLSGNLCRCTGYQKIVDAVMKTARERIKK